MKILRTVLHHELPCSNNLKNASLPPSKRTSNTPQKHKSKDLPRNLCKHLLNHNLYFPLAKPRFLAVHKAHNSHRRAQSATLYVPSPYVRANSEAARTPRRAHAQNHRHLIKSSAAALVNLDIANFSQLFTKPLFTFSPRRAKATKEILTYTHTCAHTCARTHTFLRPVSAVERQFITGGRGRTGNVSP